VNKKSSIDSGSEIEIQFRILVEFLEIAVALPCFEGLSDVVPVALFSLL